MVTFQFKIFLSLIRALFPRWNFFDRVGHHLELEFKTPESSSWERIYFEQGRRPLGLFVNPEVNLALAQVNVVEHFISDLTDLQEGDRQISEADIHSLTTFQMLRSLLRMKLQEHNQNPGRLQFKILACSPRERSDVYVSEWISLGES